MRIAAYVHPNRTTFRTTGVGKHIVSMVLGLNGQPDFDLRLLASRSTLVNGQYPADSALRNLPMTTLPGGRAFLEWSWNFLGRPRIDRWCPQHDWIYCPIETFVPTRQAKLAVTIHDVQPLETELPWSQTRTSRRIRRNWKWRLRPIHRHADLILAVSEFTADRWRKLMGVPRAPIVVVGNGVEEEFFQPVTSASPDPRIGDRPYALMVGGLDERKGTDVVFEVAHQLQRLGSDMMIAIAGFVSEAIQLRAKAIPNIQMLGYVDTPELPGLLQRSVALLFPSRYEGFGIPAIEAMAVGTPAVVSRLAALPEIAGDAGVYIDVNQPKTIAQQLGELHRDSTMRQQIIAAGRRRAELFHWSACVQRLVSALRDFRK